MLDSDFMEKKWQITTSLSNNKTDRYIITALELAKWITKKRRKELRERMAVSCTDPVKPKHYLDVWLIDLALFKAAEYIERFRMKDVLIVNMNIKSIG